MNWQCTPISVLMNNAKVEDSGEHVPVASDAAVLPLTIGAADWPCWRGANGDGRSTMTGVSTDWSNGLEKKWEVDYLCQGGETATWSAPVVQGNRLVVMGRDSTNDLVFCLHAEDGGLIWKSSYPAAASKSYGTGSRATPWIDDDRVYTFGRSGDLVCWNLLDGKKRWHQNVHNEGGEETGWGHSSTPLVFESIIVVNAGGTARTIAYNKMDGTVIWKSGAGPAGYSAVTKMLMDGDPVILAYHGDGLAALHPSDGTILWDTSWETRSDVNASTPVVTGDKIFITSSYGKGGQLLKVDREGVEVQWKNKAIASHHSDPFIIDGHIYGYSGMSMQNRGKFKCVDLESGIEKWSTRDMGWGTCVHVDGYILCSDIKGNLFLMKPNPNEFTLVTHLPKALGKVRGASWTTPVLANGNLYLRFKEKLVCYDIKSEE